MRSEYPTVAIVREVSPSIGDCELSFLEREPIDYERAVAQHRAYVDALASLGLKVVVLPAEPHLPDAVFVEDTAVVVPERAVVAFPGAASRRPEVVTIAETLARYRPVSYISGGGTLDGGDVMHFGKTLYAGRTARTNDEGADELASILAPHGYRVVRTTADGCLHYMSGASNLGRDTVLVNPAWVVPSEVDGAQFIEIDPSEPWAANTVAVGDTVLMSAAFPRTIERVRDAGFDVRELDISEFQKAEGGLSCLSILL